MTGLVENNRGKHTTISPALFIGIFLAAVYCLTYSGTFTTDDEHILASRAISLAFDGVPNDDRVLGNTRIFAYTQWPLQKSVPGLNIEPLQAILGAPLAGLSILIGTGRIQTIFLLTIISTALAGVCVYFAVGEMGCSKKSSALVALFFGLGTQAWPYSRTFFRDPLAMTFLALAWLCALRLRRSPDVRSRWLAGLGLVVGTSLGILTKNTVVLVLPSLAILLFPENMRFPTPKTILHKWRNLVIVLLTLLVLVVILLTAGGIFARFNLRYYLEILKFFFTTPHPHLAQAWLGPLLSPGKSIFLYSPVLLLPLFSLIHPRREILSAWLYALLLILAQGLFYDQDWWGHINWGLRFFMPAIPLLMISSGRLVEKLIDKTAGQISLILLSALAVFVQLTGVLVPVQQYYSDIAALGPDAASTVSIWTFAHSALAWHAAWLLAGNAWDLAAVRIGMQALPVVLLLVLLVLFALLALNRPRRWVGWGLVILLVFSAGWMLVVYGADPVYFKGRSDLAAVRTELRTRVAPGDLLALASYGTPAWDYWMNWGNPAPGMISLPFTYGAGPKAGIPEETQAVLSIAESRQGNMWLLLPCDSPASLNLLTNQASISTSSQARDDTFLDGDCETHLLFYPKH